MNIFQQVPGGTERLAAVSPVDLAAYLKNSGWSLASEETIRSFWTRKTQPDGEFEVLVPAAPAFKDYAVRVSEALATLEIAEHRSYLSILSDIETHSADIIRVRVSGRGSREGTIGLEAGVNLFERTRELFYAAACSALDLRSVHPNRKPEEAARYLKGVRLGQTEPGSFIVSVISRVPPVLVQQEELFKDDTVKVPPEPFARRVIETLGHSLVALNKVSPSGPGGGPGPLNAIVSEGVSANLCEALAGLEDEDQKVTVRFTWAKSRQPPPGIPSEFTFDQRKLSVFGEAARFYRANTPERDFLLTGYVFKLAKRLNAKRGTIGVVGIVEGKSKIVSMHLDQVEYRLAVQAHRENLTISCTGELVREGHGLSLRYGRNFAVEAPAAD